MVEAEEQAKGTRLVDQRVEDISVRLAKVETFFKVAFGVGAIFGAVGVWGFQMISSVSSRISGLDTELTEVAGKLNRVDSRAGELKETYKSLQSLFTKLQVDTVSANKEAEIARLRIDGQIRESVYRLGESARVAGETVDEKFQAAKGELGTGRTDAVKEVQNERDTTLKRVQEEKGLCSSYTERRDRPKTRRGDQIYHLVTLYMA